MSFCERKRCHLRTIRPGSYPRHVLHTTGAWNLVLNPDCKRFYTREDEWKPILPFILLSHGVSKNKASGPRRRIVCRVFYTTHRGTKNKGRRQSIAFWMHHFTSTGCRGANSNENLAHTLICGGQPMENPRSNGLPTVAQYPFTDYGRDLNLEPRIGVHTTASTFYHWATTRQRKVLNPQ